MWYSALLCAVLHTIYGVLTVKLFAFLETGFNPESLGNMSLFGGVFMMPLAYWLGAKLFKRPCKEVFDIFTPCMIFTLLCARVNCILSGCCMGLLIPGLDGLRWPTRELEIIFYIILLLWLCPRVLHGKTQGTVYPIYMAAYGAFRFIIEWFRTYDGTSIIHRGHIWALSSLIMGLSIYFTQKERITKQGGKNRK